MQLSDCPVAQMPARGREMLERLGLVHDAQKQGHFECYSPAWMGPALRLPPRPTVANGATKSTSSVRRLIAITHGAATFIILLGGFGALARLGVMHGNLPGWVLVKLACWAVLAVLVAIPYRKPALARTIFWLLPVLGGIAVVMAIYKPF